MLMLTIFDTKKTKEQKSYVRNLIALAKIKGVLSKTAIDFIYKFATSKGLKDYEISYLLKEDVKAEQKVTPANDAERFELIFELVQLVISDGKIKDKEVDLLIEIAKNIGFKKAFTGVIVNKIAMSLSNGIEKEAIREDLANFLSF